MRKTIIFIFFVLLLLPCLDVRAGDYSLKNGKFLSGTYAGANEDDFNYYQIKVSKADYLEITAKTSNKKALVIDICDENRQVIAQKVTIPNGKKVLHKAENNKLYYLKIKGTEGVTYNISCKTISKDLATLKYAKKYNYTITNASFAGAKDALLFKLKTNRTGNLQLMCKVDSPLLVQYLNSKKSPVSQKELMKGNALTGIGVQAKKTYYIKMWNAEGVTEGTTTITNMKFQIPEDISTASENKSRSRAKSLRQGVNYETLVPAGNASTVWYKMHLYKKQKIKISIESRMFQNNGKHLKITLYNKQGKKLNKSAIVIKDKAAVVYKKKKYRMKYDVKDISPTVDFPEGIYYVKITSSTKTSSGSYCIRWK